MKTKKIMAVLSIFTAITLLSVASSHAYWLFNMQIVKVGQTSAGVELRVQDAATGTEIFQGYLDATNQNSMLAIILTAQAQTSNIHVEVNDVDGLVDGIVLSNE
jgi:hypothetical protein